MECKLKTSRISCILKLERKRRTGRRKPYFLRSKNTNRYQELCHSESERTSKSSNLLKVLAFLSSLVVQENPQHPKRAVKREVLHHRRQMCVYLQIIFKSHGIILKKIEKMFQTRHAESYWYYILKKYMIWNNGYSLLFKECIHFHVCFFFFNLYNTNGTLSPVYPVSPCSPAMPCSPWGAQFHTKTLKQCKYGNQKANTSHTRIISLFLLLLRNLI